MIHVPSQRITEVMAMNVFLGDLNATKDESVKYQNLFYLNRVRFKWKEKKSFKEQVSEQLFKYYVSVKVQRTTIVNK